MAQQRVRCAYNLALYNDEGDPAGVRLLVKWSMLLLLAVVLIAAAARRIPGASTSAEQVILGVILVVALLMLLVASMLLWDAFKVSHVLSDLEALNEIAHQLDELQREERWSVGLNGWRVGWDGFLTRRQLSVREDIGGELVYRRLYELSEKEVVDIAEQLARAVRQAEEGVVEARA